MKDANFEARWKLRKGFANVVIINKETRERKYFLK